MYLGTKPTDSSQEGPHIPPGRRMCWSKSSCTHDGGRNYWFGNPLIESVTNVTELLQVISKILRLTDWLSTWSRTLLENLRNSTASQKIFHDLLWPESSSPLSKRACHLYLYIFKPTKTSASKYFSILSCYLRLPNGLFLSCFPTQILYAFLKCVIPFVCIWTNKWVCSQ